MSRLAHRRVIITRPRDQSAEMLAAFAESGAEAIALPTIIIAPPAETGLLDLAVRTADSFDGVIFASANAVRAFFGHARESGAAPVRKSGSWVAAVGPATAAALPAGWAATLIPAAYSSAGLLAMLAPAQLAGQRILVPRAAIAADTVPAGLARQGAVVMAVEAYQTLPAMESRPIALHLLPAHPPADANTAVVFTSPSTARALAQLLGDDFRARLAGATLAAIGPATTAALAGLGLRVHAQAATASTTGLVRALLEHWNA